MLDGVCSCNCQPLALAYSHPQLACSVSHHQLKKRFLPSFYAAEMQVVAQFHILQRDDSFESQRMKDYTVGKHNIVTGATALSFP